MLNPAPVFVQDTTYTGENGKDEYGNKGKYLTTVTVPVTGWYLDEECKQEAVVTLNWNGKVKNPIDDHQFNLNNPIPVYRKIAGEVECKYMAGTFYSDADRAKGEEVIKPYAGTYHPTAAEGKWWIVIDDNGKVTIHATDSKNAEYTYEDVAMDLTMDKKTTNHNNPNFGQITAVTDIKVVIPEWRTAQDNKTLANIAQCAETTFTFIAADNGSSYFMPSVDAIKYANADDGNPWEVQTKSTAAGYNKDLFTKIYKNDRAYSDANKERARKYFENYPGTYYIEDPELDYKLTVTDNGDIYWGDYASGKAPLPADVQFDAIRDENHDGKVNEGENTIVPGTISVWLNGYSTGTYTEKDKATKTTDGTQRADLTWNDTYVDDQPDTEHKFKTSGNVKGYLGGVKTSLVTFALGKYYIPSGDEVTEEDFVKPGTYETTDAEYKIVIEKDDETGKFTYTFYRPDTPETKYPLKLFGSGDAAYLRGKIGMMKKNDVYIVVTKGPYEGFLLTGYEVEYNDLGGKQNNSSNSTTVVLPARTRFTNYALGDTGTNKNIIVVEEGQEKKDGTPYSRLSLALHNVKPNSTIYLEDDIKIGFEAKLPDGVGNVTIDGQGHKILRDTFVNPNTIIMDPEISLMALEEEGAELPEEHYDGAILQVGAEDTVTLKNVTIDGEGKWEIDQDKLKYDKELNKDYDVNVLDDPNGGHPIKEHSGNLVSTDSLIKVAGGTLILDGVTLENFFAGDGYDDDRHFIDFRSTEDGKLEIKSETVFKHNASRSGVCIGNTDEDEILLSGCTTMQDNYCYGGNGGLVVAMEGTQVYMKDGTKIINNITADTNGVFVQLHKKTDGVKDGDNKGEIYSKLHMDGGEIANNIGLRGGSYGWGNTVYLYNGGAFEMNGGTVHDNIGAGISSIYQQPSADTLMLNGGKIYNNTCSLKDDGTDWALDIALMNIGTIGEDMFVGQNFVVGAAAILGGYASGDEYLTNNGKIEGNISVYSYFNNEGNVTTVVNNNTIDGDIRLENGSMIKNNENGLITGNVTVRGSLTESAGESSFHNEGDVKGDIELAEGAHLYNSGEVYGDVTVKSGGTLELNCNEEGHSHGGVIHGDVYLYPDGLIYADVKPTQIDGTIYLEYETEEDRDRMLDVLDTCGITYADIVEIPHVHAEYDETVVEPDNDDYKCTDSWVTLKTCKTCGKVVESEESEPTGHEYYVASVTEATCTTGRIENIRCMNCSAYNSTAKELKHHVSEPLGHKYVENEDLHIPATEYASGHEYYICTECGDLLEIEIPELVHGATKHTFQTDDGEIDKAKGVVTKPETCTEDGEMTFTCEGEGCGAEIRVAIPAKGHRYPDPKDYEVIESADSTCTTAGYITYAPRCTVCNKIDESNKCKVNLQKLPHVMSDWEDVEEGDYLCTAERKQTRSCETCGETEERLGGETGHTWDSTHVTCTVCGYTTSGHQIDYMLNGGVAPKSLADITDRVYTPGKPATLWQPDADEPWTKQTATGQAVFVGWCGTDLGAAPLATAPKDEFIFEVDIPEDADAIVFAVWAVDRNKNNTPDYNETTVSIIYDKNGGTGDVPEPLTDVLPGAAYPLETALELTKDGNIFAGWSLERKNEVITTEEDSLEIITSLVASPYTVPKDTNKDITLYAVYAQDSDNTGKPDYCEDALHVEYYINGGQVHEGYTVNEEGMFYVCNDYHHSGDMATLLAVEYGRTMIYRDKAVLIGWTAGPHAALVTSEEELGGLTISEVSLTGTEANAKVYALWAADENDNHVADYNETTLTHTYHQNQFLAENGKSTISGLKLNVDDKKVPERQNNILPGMGVELAANDSLGSADLVDSEGNKKGHYIQVGWSGYSHGACMSKKDYNNWLIAGDENGYTKDGKYYRVIYDTRFQNAFALWATDNDENGTADFLETHYTITLNLNGGTPTGDGFPHTTVVDYGDSFTFPADPTKAGHIFKGWSADGGKTLYKAGNTVEVTADKTYTALYDAITHTVKLDLNGGTGGDDFTAENPVNEGESFTFPADPTKAGYTFKGWSAEGDEKLYKAGDEVEVTVDVTYTAQYEAVVAPAKTFKVTLDLNGGTAGEGFAASSTVNEGESFTFPANPTKTGYIFKGWSAGGGKTLYKAGDKVVVTADVTYTAQYEEVVAPAKTFKVTLDLNGGTAGEGFAASSTVNEGESFTFPANPTKTGYIFKGWSVEGDEKLYKAGDTVVVTADVTYTAQYEEVVVPAKTFKVTLDLNGGTAGEGFAASSTVNEGESFTFPADPTKAGYTFKGWSAEGDEKLYKAGDEVEVTADVTYTAQYEAVVAPAKTFKVMLDVNGGNGGAGFTAENTVNEGESFTFPADPIKDGYTFKGWSAEGDEKLYKAGDTVTVTADVTYTAQYEAVVAPTKTFKVTLDLNGGTAGEGFTASSTVNEGESFTFPADPTKADYIFKGWSVEGDEKLYKAGDEVEVTADVTYTAQYEAVVAPAKTFKVMLDLNGGTAGEGFAASSTVNEGESFTFPANPTKAGYTFKGWSAEGDGHLYKAGDTVTVTSDVTYTAQYEAVVAPVKTFKVTLELNGGTGGAGFKAENSVNEGESFTFPADPTKSGYTFMGWSAEGDEKLYKAGDTIAVASDLTFTAQWNKAGTGSGGGGFMPYAVHFETNGGSKVASQGILRNGVVKEPTAPTKDGYTFAGWYEDKDLTIEYDFTSKVTKSFTLYAKWNDAKSDNDPSIPASTPDPGAGGASLNFEDHYAYIVGYPDGSVHPDDTITRAEVATIFYRLMSDESRNTFMTNKNGYSDVAPEDWFNIAVSTMSAASVIKGYEDGTFAPEQPITRAEFAVMAARFDSDEYSGEDKFPDISKHWAHKEINRAAQKGWVSGYQDGTFGPDRYITRAEAMRLVNRVLGRIPSAEHLHDDMTVWPDNSDKSAWYYADVQEATNSHYYEKNGEYEVWTAIREMRNWAELERR